MPRRYGADGTRLWNGKTPEEFTEADAYRFMVETEAILQRKELMDDPAQPAPASGKEEFYLSKKDDVLLTPEQIAAEERRWLFDAPIAELAEVKGVSIDEAVKMRTDAVLQEAVVPITVSVRPIEPQGKLIGFASVNFGGVVIDDFKVVDGKNGIFLGAPSKPDPASRTGYRATVRIPDRATQERINAAGVEAYHAAVEQLVARAQAVRPAPIKEQMAEAAKQAGKENAARPAPAKAKEARNDRYDFIGIRRFYIVIVVINCVPQGILLHCLVIGCLLIRRKIAVQPDQLRNARSDLAPIHLNIRAARFSQRDALAAVIFIATAFSGYGVGTPADAVLLFQKIGTLLGRMRRLEKFIDAGFPAFKAASICKRSRNFISSDKSAGLRNRRHIGVILLARQ